MNFFNKIKFSYHLFCFLFLLYIAFFLLNSYKYIKYGLIFIAFIHLYDSLWFYYNNGNAPI